MSDSQVDWQSLSETYSKMWDDELLELAADSADLTEVAREVLRGEIKKRGLDQPGAASNAPRGSVRPTAGRDRAPGVGLTEGEEAGGEEGAPGEFTWKTPLCECEERTEAWQVCEALRQAGIESWMEKRGAGGPTVLVAADQFDAAEEIAARPIPPEIVELSKLEMPEFEAPVCPECGAEDPILESVEPFNTWLCEACGGQWTEAASELDDAER